MKIKFYSYNAFVIESGDKKIPIDPGALFFYFFRLTTLIPKSDDGMFKKEVKKTGVGCVLLHKDESINI